MQFDPKTQELLQKIEFLFEHYSKERRATTQPFLLEVAKKNVKDYVYEPSDDLVRETLMEHVGSLPVIATAIYPYINDPEVNLGEALIMLAIHDIGELITGDEITFTKKASAKDPEYAAAISLLDPFYHDFYEDVETKTSKTAKFAKAVDKITPDILDYLTPADVTVWRMRHFANVEADKIVDVIVEHKRPYMLWNSFMTDFHKLLIDKLDYKLKQL